MIEEILDELQVPEDCAVRVIDLDVRVPGLTAVDETGFANIYINARLSLDAQREALKHELRHHRRGDMFSDADIRAVERAADQPDAPRLWAIDGTALPELPKGFAPEGLRRAGRGLYLPAGQGVQRAARDIAALSETLGTALRACDVNQTPPMLSLDRALALTDDLCPEDVAFIAFQPETRAGGLPAMMQLCREMEDRLYGAIFYDAQGKFDNALVTLEVEENHRFKLVVDIRRRRGRLAVYSVDRQVDGGGFEQVYG